MLRRVWLFVTSWTVARQPPLSIGFSRQDYWSGMPFLPPGDLSDPGFKPKSPALAGRFFTSSTTWETLSILHMVMHICQSQSPSSSLPPLPPLCPHVGALHLHIYSCPPDRLISTIFLDSIYMHYYMIFVFLSDLLHSVWQILGPSISLEMIQMYSF